MTARPAAVAAAFALALVAVANGVPAAGRHLNRTAWYLAFAGLAVALYWPMLAGLRRAGRAWAAEGRASARRAVAACLGFAGLAVAAAGRGTSRLPDNLWVLDQALQPVFDALLTLAQVTAVALACGLGLSVLTWLLPPAGVPVPRPERRPGAFALAVGVGLAAVNGTALGFLREERTAHYWDYAAYWVIASDYAGVLAESPAAALDQLAESVRATEYTLLPAALPALGMTAFGDSRAAYVLVVANVYGGLILAAAVWANRAVAARAGLPAGWRGDLAAALVVAFLPVVWVPTLRGYLDLGGVAVAVALLGFSLAKPWREFRWPHVLAVGLALALLALFRRWYSFWVVAFLAVAAAEAALRSLALLRRRAPSGEHVRGWLPPAAAGGVALLAIVMFAWVTVLRVARTTYGDAYAAYRLPVGPWARLDNVLTDIGYGYTILYAAAALQLAWHPSTRRAAAVATALLVVTHVHFHQIQDMGWHHRMLYAPSFVVVVGLAARRRLDAPGRYRTALLVGLAAPYILASLLTFRPELDGLRVRLRPLTPRSPTYPEVRDDIDELTRLAADLHELAAARGTLFCVVASSAELNQAHTQTVHRSLGLPAPRPARQRMITEVDQVGGFPAGFFDCGVVAVAAPVQLHLRPDEQQVTQLLAGDLTAGTGLSAAFEPRPGSYRLTRGVTATVYVRTRPFTDAEIAEFTARLKAAHPGVPRVYEPPAPVPPWPPGVR